VDRNGKYEPPRENIERSVVFKTLDHALSRRPEVGFHGIINRWVSTKRRMIDRILKLFL